MDVTSSVGLSTNNSIDVTTRKPWEPPYTTAWVVASTIVLAILMIFGTFANAMTIAVIRRSAKLRTKYYTLIMSLCVSDLISALLSPLFLYRRTWGFDYFAWPDFLCKLYWGIDYWTSFATALHILSFALLRFIGVTWPTAFRRISGRHIVIWLATIWTVSFFGGLVPHAIFNEVKVVDRYSKSARWASCSLAERWFQTWKVFIQFAYPIFLYIPAALVILISIVISVKLSLHRMPGENSACPNTNTNLSGSRSTNKRRKKDRQIIIQLGLIVGSFLLGYAPVTAFHWYTGFTIDESNPALNKVDWQFAMIQYILLRFSECLNPVFYNLASRKMRGETYLLLQKLRFVKKALRSPKRSFGSKGLSSVTTSSV